MSFRYSVLFPCCMALHGLRGHLLSALVTTKNRINSAGQSFNQSIRSEDDSSLFARERQMDWKPVLL